MYTCVTGVWTAVATGAGVLTCTAPTVVGNLPEFTNTLGTGCADSGIGGSNGQLYAPNGVSTGALPPACTPGTGGCIIGKEGTAPSVGPASGVDLIYFDSTAHAPLLSVNNGAYLQLATWGANTFAGQQIISLNGATSTPPASLVGTWFVSGGSATTTKPQFLVEPTGTTSTGWSTTGTGLGVNAATGFTGNLADFQLNGVSKISIGSNVTIGFSCGSSAANPRIRQNATILLFERCDGASSNTIVLAAQFHQTTSTGVFGWDPNSFPDGTLDTGWSRKTSTPGWIKAGNGTANDASGTIEAATIVVNNSSFTFNGHTCTLVSTVVTCP